ncbi:hypothetical protein [Riemerella columbipharyngis]|uniref:hypothetical protein n=1 Tax=Riemerella columbipharyngis TaxID=1071918 RepID=UPI0015A39E3D|nr:hypothetical protein [Riemerella columbipharyngis]
MDSWFLDSPPHWDKQQNLPAKVFDIRKVEKYICHFSDGDLAFDSLDFFLDNTVLTKA